MPEQESEEQPTSMDIAYKFVLPSYEWTLRRLEAVESRLQSLLMFVASITLAIPVIAGALIEDLSSIANAWAIAIFLCAALAAGIGLGARWKGLVFLDLNDRINATGHSRWQFRRDTLCHARFHYDQNTRRIAWKGLAADAMSFLVLVEASLGAWWIVSALANPAHS